MGEVPKAPDLYAFTLQRPQGEQLRVVYIGMTTHLWMVTKGSLPTGDARGGQRYGRPRHAGQTRQRVNILISRARSEGWEVSHWVRPIAPETEEDVRKMLLLQERELISRWGLVSTGWNRQ